jgi:hypothetical protein
MWKKEIFRHKPEGLREPLSSSAGMTGSQLRFHPSSSRKIDVFQLDTQLGTGGSNLTALRELIGTR